jgi:oligoribonuclease NrnB/cAMP/cGMP phosphodiesterase (DHH superfamily)
MPASHPVTVLYHADCPDGFGAAYAAWLRFGDGAAYRPMHHGQPLDLAEFEEHDVFVLDFSFSPDVLEAMAGRAHSVIQIDHHASARQPWLDRLVPHPDGGERWQHPALPLTVHFDLAKSGARLAWEFLHPGTAVPLLLQHVEDGDLWRFALSGTRPINRALALAPFDFPIWDRLVRETADPSGPGYRGLLLQGEAIEQFFQTEVERLAGSRLVMQVRLRGEPVDPLQAMRHGLPVITDGDRAWRAVEGLAVNSNALFSSELGNRLAEMSGSFGLVWYLAGDGEAKVSVRGIGKLDLAEIAVRYGGGGHPNAAGFRLPLGRFMDEIISPKN